MVLVSWARKACADDRETYAAVGLATSGLVGLEVQDLIAGGATEAALVPDLIEAVKLLRDVHGLAALNALWVRHRCVARVNSEYSFCACTQ